MGYFVFLILTLSVIAGLFLFKIKTEIGDLCRISRIGLFGFVAVMSLVNAMYQVPAGNVGIVYSFGSIVGQRSEGLQWVWPWQSVMPASIQVQGHKFEKLESFSSESQQVFVKATLNIQISPDNIQGLYRTVGAGYTEILVNPRVQQAFKDETVKYRSTDIAPYREDIRKTVRERLMKELEKNSIIVQDLLLDNLWFTDKFQAAIETKQEQSQLALAAQEKVKTKTAEAQQAVEEAKGISEAVLITAQKQAEANRVLASSLTPQYVQYVLATKLSPNIKVMMLPTGQNFIMSSEMLKDEDK